MPKRVTGHFNVTWIKTISLNFFLSKNTLYTDFWSQAEQSAFRESFWYRYSKKCMHKNGRRSFFVPKFSLDFPSFFASAPCHMMSFFGDLYLKSRMDMSFLRGKFLKYAITWFCLISFLSSYRYSFWLNAQKWENIYLICLPVQSEIIVKGKREKLCACALIFLICLCGWTIAIAKPFHP